MNPYLQSVLLGIVEGLTEFLPVSSTAHLRIAEALMKIPLEDAYWKMYTIVIQLGAIVALALLFLGRIVEFIRTFPRGENGDRTWLNHPISLTMIAFAFTSVPALALHKWSDQHLGNLTVMALGAADWRHCDVGGGPAGPRARTRRQPTLSRCLCRRQSGSAFASRFRRSFPERRGRCRRLRRDRLLAWIARLRWHSAFCFRFQRCLRRPCGIC